VARKRAGRSGRGLSVPRGRAGSPRALRFPRRYLAWWPPIHGLASQAGPACWPRAGDAGRCMPVPQALRLVSVDPFASGLGGGGFALIYSARLARSRRLIFREDCTRALRPDLFMAQLVRKERSALSGSRRLGSSGCRLRPSRRGGAFWPSSCAVGQVGAPLRLRGAGQALARDCPGISVGSISCGRRAQQSPDAASFLLRCSRASAALWPASRRRSRAAARVWPEPLARLRREGRRRFYRGEIADAIVTLPCGDGGLGVLERNDLAGYAAIERAPLLTTFRGRRIFAFPPPSPRPAG